VLACAVLAMMAQASRLVAADMTEAEIKALTDGTYVLESWELNGQQVHPPNADGRFSLHNNVVMVIVRSRFGDKTSAFYGFGRYQLTRTTFSYGYDSWTELKASGSQIHVDYELPYQGMREFKLQTEPGKVICDHAGGRRQLIFEAKGVTYLEDLNVVRKWKRVPD
jgi:hypothetical protein